MTKMLWCDLHPTESSVQRKHHGWPFATKNWTNSSDFASLLPSLPPTCCSAKLHDLDAAPCSYTKDQGPVILLVTLLIYILGLLFNLFLKQIFLRSPKERSAFQIPQLPTKSTWASSPNFCHFLRCPWAALKANCCHIKQSKVQVKVVFFPKKLSAAQENLQNLA